MQIIESGSAQAHDSGVWRIVGEAYAEVAQFIHSDFEHIVHGTPVYFIDLNLDGLCENVQAQVDVDAQVAAASSSQGFAGGAEIRLKSFVMEALLASLKRTGSDRAAYRSLLAQRIAEVSTKAEALPSRKVTVALLKRLGLTA